MNKQRHSDPAEHSALMRLFYRNWRPTRLGLWVNRLMCWWSGLGLPPSFQAVLEDRTVALCWPISPSHIVCGLGGQHEDTIRLARETDDKAKINAAYL